jgi:flagellar basal body-associated protein FliL
MAELVELIAAILNDPPPADRPKASPGLPGDAAAPAFFMAGAAPTPTSAITPSVPFMQRPEIRWVMIAVLAVVVAAVVAYTVVIFSQRPSSSSVAANVGTPPPPPTPRPAPAPAQPPVVPAAPAPSAPPPPPAAAAASAGALAVALPADVAKSGFSYGYSNNNTDEAHAQAAALNACRTTKDAANDVNLRSLCKVVLNYSNKCIAVSMDPQAGTPGVGWALANDLQTAERQALAKCQETAGPGRRAACVLDHSACDGNAK